MIGQQIQILAHGLDGGGEGGAVVELAAGGVGDDEEGDGGDGER